MEDITVDLYFKFEWDSPVLQEENALIWIKIAWIS